jgi:hypothetical protein
VRTGLYRERRKRRRYPAFPEPVATLKAGLVWAWPDVEKSAKTTERAIVGEG